MWRIFENVIGELRRIWIRPAPMGHEPHKRTALSEGYYEEVLIIPQGSTYEPDTLIRVVLRTSL
jgi:hypothetical protein